MSSSIETRFQTDQKAGEALNHIWKALIDMGHSSLRNVKEIPSYHSGSSIVRKPSYVLLEYRVGLFGLGRRQIELTFNERPTKTLVSVRWSYPTLESQTRGSSGLMRILNERQAREIKQNTVWAVEELKNRVSGTEIEDEPVVKEIIKEVIVKIRCDYCGNLFNESFDKCPTCGGRISGKTRPEQVNFCPYCGVPREQNSGSFCIRCGKRIG